MNFQERVLKYKLWIIVIVLTLLLILTVPLRPLSPIGFSKCGRIWSEVEVREGFITHLLRKYQGTYEVEIGLKSTEYLFFEDLPDDLRAVWTLGTNNSTCFTPTQRIYIQKIGEPGFKNTVAKELLRSIDMNASGTGSVTVRLGTYLPIGQN